MDRSKKVVFVSHCILNVNSKVVGLANYSSVLKDLVNDFIERDYGIVQLPCPELEYLGLKRWSMTKEQYDVLRYREHCRNLALNIVEQVKIYQDEDYEVVGIYAIDGSPSCGYNYSCAGYNGGCFEDSDIIEEYKILEKGIFMEELTKLLEEYKLSVPFYAISENDPMEVNE